MHLQASTRIHLYNMIWLVALLLLLAAAWPAYAAQIRSSDVPSLTPANSEAPASNTVKRAGPETVTAAPAAKPATQQTLHVGMLLPLTGPQAKLGRAMLDAATLALYDMQRNKPLGKPIPNVRLVPKDTQSTAAGAQEAMRQFMEQRPTVILGPLSSAELEIILPLRREMGVPLISFTNHPALAGRGAYQFGYFAAEQAERLAQYAKLHQVQHISAVSMGDGYGRMVVDHLAKSARDKEISYGPTILLPPQSAIDDRQLAPLLSALKERQNKRQFLFIAENSPRLEMIVMALAKARLLQPNLVLIGSGIWDEPVQLASPALRGAIFTSTPKETYAGFLKKYQVTYNSTPPRISSLAYDATALVVNLLYYDGPDALKDTALQDRQGFTTPANGLVRFRPDGQAERRLALYIANGNGTVSVMEKAPASFD